MQSNTQVFNSRLREAGQTPVTEQAEPAKQQLWQNVWVLRDGREIKGTGFFTTPDAARAAALVWTRYQINEPAGAVLEKHRDVPTHSVLYAKQVLVRQ